MKKAAQFAGRLSFYRPKIRYKNSKTELRLALKVKPNRSSSQIFMQLSMAAQAVCWF
jgi:hypothetical protein